MGEPSCRMTSLRTSPSSVLRTHFTETAPISNPSKYRGFRDLDA
ncbi:MAG: hypothetical protein ACW98X_19425 [Promethearchaeota archaeon]